MDCSTPGFPILHYFLEFVQTHCPLIRWCHPTISSSVAHLSSCPQSFLASGSFPVSQVFASGGQSIAALATVLPMNIQSWFPLGLSGLISLMSKGFSRVFSSTTVQRHQFFGVQTSFWSKLQVVSTANSQWHLCASQTVSKNTYTAVLVCFRSTGLTFPPG